MITKFIIWFVGENFGNTPIITYYLIIAVPLMLLLRKIGLKNFSIKGKVNFEFGEPSANGPKPKNNSNVSKPKSLFKNLKDFICSRKRLKSLPPDIFAYFCENELWQHIYLTPYDYKVFLLMMSPEEIDNRSSWLQNWNNQDWLDIDFKQIVKLVKKYRK